MTRNDKTFWALWLIIGLALLAWLCPDSHGANWYVDNAASGSQDGTSWANAWTNFSDVTWGGGGVVAGDTLNISGGSTSKVYTETWTVGADGSAGNPITIRPGQDANHNGTVVFDYQAGAVDDAVLVANRDYITFAGAGRLWFINNYDAADKGYGKGISAGGSGSSYLVISSCLFSNFNNPIKLMTSSTLGPFVISNSTFLQTKGDAAIAVVGSDGDWDANIVSSNFIECVTDSGDESSGPDGIQATSAISIFSNRFYNVWGSCALGQHPDMCQVTGNKIKIYANDFCNVGDSDIDYDVQDNSNGDRVESLRIYNNTFRIVDVVGGNPDFIRLYSGSAVHPMLSISNLLIANNTFIDQQGYSTWTVSLQNFQGGNPTAGNNEIKNNIWHNCDNAFTFATSSGTGYANGSGFVFSNNIYSYPGHDAATDFEGTSRNAYDWVANQEPTGKTNAPVFASYVYTNSANNLALSASDTSAKDAGVVLSDYFTTDKIGTARGATWDIGAFEYQASGATTNSTRFAAWSWWGQ